MRCPRHILPESASVTAANFLPLLPLVLRSAFDEGGWRRGPGRGGCPFAILTKAVLLGALFLTCGGQLLAQEQSSRLDELLHSAQQWANENLDQDALRVLQSGDRRSIEKLFAQVQGALRGDYVLDLAALKDTARGILPLLEQYEETYPYALWLRTRLDYLDVAEQLRQRHPPPKGQRGAPQKPTNPAPSEAREIWIEKIANRSWPPGARPLVAKLKPIFAAEKVPPELVWLAEVESSFDPRARSPAGAAGLYQLMPATAKRFGLKTWPFDQRLKPEDSARASAKYLATLHHQFKDWRLALAAYNAGEGTVVKLLKQKKSSSFETIATKLPAETQMFVPRVEATVLRREGIRLKG